MDAHNVVLLSPRGRLTCSPEKSHQRVMLVAQHPGVLHQGFLSGLFDENMMENIDEVHFVLHLRQWPHIRISGRYSCEVCGCCVRGRIHDIGSENSRRTEICHWRPDVDIHERGKEFSNEKYSWQHIRSVQSGGWIKPSFHIILKNLVHFRVMYIVHCSTKVVWCDNCTSHNDTPQPSGTLASKSTLLQFLPPSTTHLCQPTDTFAIS
jgi:hypothetical protein